MENVGWFFLGIVASIIGQFVFRFFEKKREYKNKVKLLKKELSINLKSIKNYQEISKRYRQALTERRLSNFYEYFPFVDFIYPVLQDMFVKGELYKAITDEDQLFQLKKMASFYSAAVQENTTSRMDKIENTDDFDDGFSMLETLDYTFDADIQSINNILSALK